MTAADAMNRVLAAARAHAEARAACWMQPRNSSDPTASYTERNAQEIYRSALDTYARAVREERDNARR